MGKEIKKWDTLETRFIDNYRIFNLLKVRRRHPEWGKEGEFVVIDSPRWVNIIPITVDREVVLVEQYRHGIDEVTLEIPGGLVEDIENPLDAAERECTEETGYAGKESAILLGENIPNPAFLNNMCWSFVWFDCTKVSAQHLDGNEDINIVKVPLDDITKMILNKKIQHSLVLTAFFYYSLRYGL